MYIIFGLGKDFITYDFRPNDFDSVMDTGLNKICPLYIFEFRLVDLKYFLCRSILLESLD